jgi:tetratricopeptide (TPR) repeat protein
MEVPSAVVVPFGVPEEGRGLGLGLAALVHAFVHVDGVSVAIAQLQSRREGDVPEAARSPVEAYVPPAAWHSLSGRGDGPAGSVVVVTGSFEPPVHGHGAIRLLAFDGHDGRVRASFDANVDAERAGATVVEVLDRLLSALRGDIGVLRGIQDLGWESLESVLRAERCALHDPARGGPHDRLAAMIHLGRAIGDAPDARYPVDRLTTIALEAAGGSALDGKLASAAIRALERAAAETSNNLDLVEALAAVLLRVGRFQDAERRMNAAIATAPRRARPYVLLAHALRAQGQFDSALATLQAGVMQAGPDALFEIERGTVLAVAGEPEGAAMAWREVLAADPLNPAAFGRLAALTLRTHDTATAQSLVDAALAAPSPALDVLRHAVLLALGTEAEGLPRASRLARLCTQWLERLPGDPTGLVVMARAHLALGEEEKARARLDQVERVAPNSAAAAEVLAMRLALDHPYAEIEVQSVLRSARGASSERLADVAARARKLATLHGAWMAWFAAAVAERRRGRVAAARGALEIALEIAPGAVSVHLELAEVLLELEDPSRAATHAQAAVRLEGSSPRALAMLARALRGVGRKAEAIEAAQAALAIQPDDPETRALLSRVSLEDHVPGWVERTKRAFAAWTKR